MNIPRYLYITREDLSKLVDTLATEYEIYYLTANLAYHKYVPGESNVAINLNPIHAHTSLKPFYFPQREILDLDKPIRSTRPRIVFGVKSCDLRARYILDKMFLGDPVADPFYQRQSETTIIFGSDCPEPEKNCFCTYLYGTPYLKPDDKFDLNFGYSAHGFVIETGSEKGQQIVNKINRIFRPATGHEVVSRDAYRDLAVKKIDEYNRTYTQLKNINLQEIVAKGFHSPKWKEIAQPCVQCAGCNIACPSCYCFYISDLGKDRVRNWDGCHYTGYAKVAGGANARPKVYERFRNRYQCKLNYRMTNFGTYACTGCGRCISVAPCKIDLRQVVLYLST